MASHGRERLSAERILDSAIALVGRDGLQALSMRRLGTELGTDPMAVYHYFPNKAALLDAALDHVFADLPLPSPTETPWEERLRAVAHAVRARANEHPSLFPMFATRGLATERAFRDVEYTLAALDDAGLDDERIVAAGEVFLAYLYGFGLTEIADTSAAGPAATPPSESSASPPADLTGPEESAMSWAERVAALPEEEFPVMHRLHPWFAQSTRDSEFELGLELLIAGFRQTGRRGPE